MVSDVFVKVREDQQKFEHAIPLVGIGIARAFFEALDDGERIGEQPFHSFLVGGKAAAPAIERLTGSLECFIEKMIEAELFACKRGRDHFCTRGFRASSRNSSVHNTPHTLGAGVLSRELGETSIFWRRGKGCALKCALAKRGAENGR